MPPLEIFLATPLSRARSNVLSDDLIREQVASQVLGKFLAEAVAAVRSTSVKICTMVISSQLTFTFMNHTK